MANMCQSLHCLPRIGGLYDQDWFDVLRMQWVISTQNKEENKKRKK